MASENGDEITSVHEQEPRLKGWSWIWKNIFKFPVAVVWSLLLLTVFSCTVTLALYGLSFGVFVLSGQYMLCYAVVLNPLEEKIMQEYLDTGLAINAVVTESFTIVSDDSTTNMITMQYDLPDGTCKYQLCSSSISYLPDRRVIELLILPDHMASGYPRFKINPELLRLDAQNDRLWFLVGGLLMMVFCFCVAITQFDGWFTYVFLAVYVGTFPVAPTVLSRRLRHKFENYAVLVANDTPPRAGGDMHKDGSHWLIRKNIACIHSIEHVLCPCLKARLFYYGYNMDRLHGGSPLEEEISEDGFTRLSVIPV